MAFFSGTVGVPEPSRLPPQLGMMSALSLPSPTVYVVASNGASRHAIGMACVQGGFAHRPFANADEFSEHCQRYAVHGCVIVPLDQPELQGLALQRAVQQWAQDLPFVFLAYDGDVALAAEAMRNGAVDVLVHSAPPADLIQAINVAFTHAERVRQARIMVEELEQRAADLTDAEREVLERIVRGQPNKAIAAELGLHVKSIEARRARVMRKMKAHSLPDLVRASIALANRDDWRVVLSVLGQAPATESGSGGS